MTKPELKKKLIAIRDGGMITPLLEELMGLIEARDQEWMDGKRCFGCGNIKLTDRPDLTDFCYKCIEEK
jgi:hypothetical protein